MLVGTLPCKMRSDYIGFKQRDYVFVDMQKVLKIGIIWKR